jgi:hypothetical protein
MHPGISHHFELCGQALTKIGRPFVTSSELKTHLEDAGFVDVHVADVKQPFGPWPKDKRMKQVGAMAMLMCETGRLSSWVCLWWIRVDSRKVSRRTAWRR